MELELGLKYQTFHFQGQEYTLMPKGTHEDQFTHHEKYHSASENSCITSSVAVEGDF